MPPLRRLPPLARIAHGKASSTARVPRHSANAAVPSSHPIGTGGSLASMNKLIERPDAALVTELSALIEELSLRREEASTLTPTVPDRPTSVSTRLSRAQQGLAEMHGLSRPGPVASTQAERLLARGRETAREVWAEDGGHSVAPGAGLSARAQLRRAPELVWTHERPMASSAGSSMTSSAGSSMTSLADGGSRPMTSLAGSSMARLAIDERIDEPSGGPSGKPAWPWLPDEEGFVNGEGGHAAAGSCVSSASAFGRASNPHAQHSGIDVLGESHG